MGRLTHILNQTAYKVSLKRNAYNDVVYTSSSTGIPCNYRDISLTQAGTNAESATLDGQLWFDADHAPERGEVYRIDSQYLRIEKVNISRSRLRDNDIEFYKCDVSIQRQVS